MREQAGQIVRHRKRWYLRYWEYRIENGALKRKRINYYLGPVKTRGMRVPSEILSAANDQMAAVQRCAVPAQRVLSIGDYAEFVYLPYIEKHKRPSTAKSYKDIWEDHLRPLCRNFWLKETRTYHVQGWLDQIGNGKLSRNTLKHIKSVISGMFTFAKQQNYFDGVNPAQDTTINPKAAEAQEMYAYSLEEVQKYLAVIPEPAATAFAIAAFAGLRHGEIQGLLWENYRNGEIFVSRSIWNGRVSDPKTRSGRAAVPVIRQLADRIELHRLRCGNPATGPMFSNAAGNPRSLSSVVNRFIVPSLNRCETCNKPEGKCDQRTRHAYKRNAALPEWRGWHAARRGLGSNLYRLGVSEKVIQRILRHANVTTTATYYIKTAADDVRSAMSTLEKHMPELAAELQDTNGTPSSNMTDEPSTVQ